MEIHNSSDASTDRRILETIMRAIEDGRAPAVLAEMRGEFATLMERCNRAEYQGDLWAFLAEHPAVGSEARMTTVRKALQFVTEEVAKYAAIKAQRPLTEDEKRYGNETLVPLLESLSGLLSKLPGAEKVPSSASHQI